MRTEPLSRPESSGAGNLAIQDRHLSEIVSELWENTETLVRKELELSVSELSQKADEIKQEVGEVAIGGAIVYAGVLTLIAAAALLLSKVVEPWIATLIVGAIVSAGGYALLERGKHQLSRTRPDFPETTHSIEKTSHTMKEAIHGAARR